MTRRTRAEARAARGRTAKLVLGAALALLLLAPALPPAAGQRPDDFGRDRPFGGGSPFGGRPPRRYVPDVPPAADTAQAAGEFTFARTVYNSPYSYGRRWGGAWATDYPDADNHFITGIREWAGTNLNVSARPERVEIMDERLFDYPLIYFVEPGYMELSAEEAARLGEYVARGGFLFFDDFWGENEWQNVREQMKKALPEYEIKELPLTHPVFHSYLDIEEVVQVPNIYNAQRGVTSEKGGVTPYYMGIEDKDGRLVAFFARNSDLGDAWEWINDSRYPVRYGLAAYRVGINVVIYAMSH
jgi:hypothetical protein